MFAVKSLVSVEPTFLVCYDVNIMMSRIQITMDPEIKSRARKRAAQLRISFAEYIRRLVRRDLGAPDQQADPSLVFNLGSSTGTDIASDKDALIGAAIAERRRRGDLKR